MGCFTPRPYCSGEMAPGTRLSETVLSGRYGEVRNILPFLGIEPQLSIHEDRSVDTVLSYTGSRISMDCGLFSCDIMQR
jgi:hypothetical protein